MIELIPAISVYKNKLARLSKGDISKIKYFEQTPLDMAIQFEESGIKRIHLIDLEGALTGKIVNAASLENISGYTDLRIDFGGGVMDDDNLRYAFENGATAVHAATIAAKDRDTFSSWIISYGRNKIILSADAVNGSIVMSGWSKSTKIDLMEMIEYYYEQGILYLKCTDLQAEENQQGPPVKLYNQILKAFPNIKLMASGGIRSVQDIESLQDIGVYGVIFAKAIYEGNLKLKDLEKFTI